MIQGINIKGVFKSMFIDLREDETNLFIIFG